MTSASDEAVESAPAGAAPPFRRVLLKLSGESLMGDREYGVDPKTVNQIAGEVVAVHALGVELAVVVGGGNFYRGMSAAAEGMDRATADYAGMLATLLNALALQDAFERLGAQTRITPWAIVILATTFASVVAPTASRLGSSSTTMPVIEPFSWFACTPSSRRLASISFSQPMTWFGSRIGMKNPCSR